MINNLLKIANILDLAGAEAEADWVEENLIKSAKKGYHRSGLKDSSVEHHKALWDTYRSALEANRNDLPAAFKSKDKSPNNGRLRNTARNIVSNANADYLHSIYFKDVIETRPYDLERTKLLFTELKSRYHKRDDFLSDIFALSQVTRNGWVVINYCMLTGEIHCGITDLHEIGVSVTGVPIAALDCWEHAYVADFNGNKEEYFKWWVSQMDWRGPEKRLRKLMRVTLEGLQN
jgi:Fe-Mn family superoxide dismutase